MKTAGVSHLEMCIQCGTCGGSCPAAMDMDHTPRMLFAMLRAGMRDEVLRSNTPWICVSCYHCVVRCPQEVHIADVMYTLKGMAIHEKLYTDSTAPDFSQTFVDMVETFGRSYELGLASRHYLRHFPLQIARHDADGLRHDHQGAHGNHSKENQTHGSIKGNPQPCQATGVDLMNKYLLYPGCSMESSGKAYGESINTIH